MSTLNVMKQRKEGQDQGSTYKMSHTEDYTILFLKDHSMGKSSFYPSTPFQVSSVVLMFREQKMPCYSSYDHRPLASLSPESWLKIYNLTSTSNTIKSASAL